MFNSIDDIKTANKVRGHHFFEPSTMRFFGSRILSGVIGGRYFITSERQPYSENPRRYTIREALPNGEIDTVGDFQGYATARQARAGARRIHEGR